jgi:hypothetical protein
MFLLLVFLPVLLWAICATAIGFWLYAELLSANRRSDPFEAIPDTDGDSPGVQKPGTKRTRGVLQTNRRIVTQPLPEYLKIPLGKPIRIGAVEVTPTKVMRRRMSIVSEGYRPEPLETDSLVLYLKLKNLADDYAFVPLDNFFDRQWKGGASPPPYTLLEAGKEIFFGGPAPWVSPIQSRQKEVRREWVQGRKNIDRAGVQPGEEEESFVCTDGSDAKVARHLFGVDARGQRVKAPYRGPLLWRVHVRRGLMSWRGKKVPATAVIGVEFTDKAYAE